MCEDINPPPPKRSIRNFRQLGRRIEEKNENITLHWDEDHSGHITAIFGKRSELYYKCDPDLACTCHRSTFTRSINLRTVGLGNILDFENEKTKDRFAEEGWERLFDGKKFGPKGAGETVVVEEDERKIIFYFALNDEVKDKISFTIGDDRAVCCKGNRKCAKKEDVRVTYTTFIRLIQGDASKLFSKFPDTKR